MHHRLIMVSCVRCLIAVLVCVVFPANRAYAADDAMLFRVFLKDGSSVVTYGEFARVADQVVLSVPVGGTSQDPRLHALTLAASRVDWDRTDRYAATARYQRYVATRAEADYQLLTDEVATVLRTTRKAVYAMAQRGLMPGRTKIGRRILFRADQLVTWLDQKRAPSPKE